jgi:hypothetical protein
MESNMDGPSSAPPQIMAKFNNDLYYMERNQDGITTITKWKARFYYIESNQDVITTVTKWKSVSLRAHGLATNICLVWAHLYYDILSGISHLAPSVAATAPRFEPPLRKVVAGPEDDP